MPISVVILIGTNCEIESRLLEFLRDSILDFEGLEVDDFRSGGPLLLANKELIPENILEASQYVYDLGLIYPYCGNSYNRGDPLMFVKICDLIDSAIDDALIWYGHDVNDENIHIFTPEKRRKLLDAFKVDE